MIIATAGHVDHGKTSLVRQLTGVETDTLAEEKERGLSINLGYAYLPRPGTDTALGFIDVPGHRRFINTMISGISGIDMGLLVVAADDGPMPQTTEHLDVLDILGVRQLTVAISKIDRAGAARLGEVDAQVRSLLRQGRWQDTMIFHVSNEDGRGVAGLKDYLLRQTQQRQVQRARGGFRLSIDRCFTAKGAGLVVTGTASAGSVNEGDQLLLMPSRREVRVRGLRVHDRAASTATAGQRVALNLAGKIASSDSQRGDWLVDPAFALAANRLDVAFRLLPGAPFPLKHLAPVKLYLGASRSAGRLALIDRETRHLLPGEDCLAQLILEKPASTMIGERFLLRDHAENLILGGGTVLDPDGPRYGKSRPGRLAWLRAMQAPTPRESLAQLLEQGLLVDLDRFWTARNLPPGIDDKHLNAGTRTFESEGKHWAVPEARWTLANQRVVRVVSDWHDARPEQPGIKMTTLRAELAKQFEPALVMATVVSRLQAGELVLRDGYISREGFSKTESAQTRAHWAALRRYLQACGAQIPLHSELARATGIVESELQQVIKEAVRAGNLHRLNDNRYALPEQLLYFSERLLEADRLGETLSVTGLKPVFRSGRKLTIELLEYFDSVRFTKRMGDIRVVLDGSVPWQLFSREQSIRKSDIPGGVPGLQNQ